MSYKPLDLEPIKARDLKAEGRRWRNAGDIYVTLDDGVLSPTSSTPTRKQARWWEPPMTRSRTG